MSNVLKLRPGFLVCFSTRVENGVEHLKSQVREEVLPDGAVRKEWQAATIIHDPEEFKAVSVLRSRVRNIMKGVTTNTGFALMCPREDEQRLSAAITEMDALALGWNETSKVYKLRVSTVLAEIAENKADAIKAIKSEVVDLLARMEAATRAGSVRDIRAAANEAAQKVALLDLESEDGDDEIAQALAVARGVARKIVKRVEKGGEDLAAVLEQQNLEPIAAARLRFIARPNAGEELS